MAINYKDISELSQKSTVAGTEKIPVSATEYITPSQIAGLVSEPTALAELSEDTTHRVVTDTEKDTWNGKYTKPSGGIPASDLAPEVIPDVPDLSTSVTEDANSDTKTSSPKSVKTYVDGIVGNVESLLAAI